MEGFIDCCSLTVRTFSATATSSCFTEREGGSLEPCLNDREVCSLSVEAVVISLWESSCSDPTRDHTPLDTPPNDQQESEHMEEFKQTVEPLQDTIGTVLCPYFRGCRTHARTVLEKRNNVLIKEVPTFKPRKCKMKLKRLS